MNTFAMHTSPARADTANGNVLDEPSLAEKIRQRIIHRLGPRVRRLEVIVREKRVLLKGECSTYYSKQLAQHAALGVIEDEKLVNQIEVGLPFKKTA